MLLGRSLWNIVSILLVLFVREPVNSLQCYKCNSLQTPECTYGNVASHRDASKWIKTCLNETDTCHMSYTLNIETYNKVSISRDCISAQKAEEFVRQYGPDLVGNVRSNREILEVHMFMCGENSLCNGQFPDDESVLECYTCNERDSEFCAYDASHLTHYNSSYLVRCPQTAGYQCAMMYKTRPNSVASESDVKRFCLSDDDLKYFRKVLGDDLVGYEHNNGANHNGGVKLETRVFVCRTSGCNLVFPDFIATVEPPPAVMIGKSNVSETALAAATKCYVCNDQDNANCDLEGSDLVDSGLLVACPTTSQYYCIVWYKMEFGGNETVVVVRSCITATKARTLGNKYGVRGIPGGTSSMAKTDYLYNMLSRFAICNGTSHPGCNLQFPPPAPRVNYCYECQYPDDKDCLRNGSSLRPTELLRCPNPDDLCAMSYNVTVPSKNSIDTETVESSFRRFCISSDSISRATKAAEEVADDNRINRDIVNEHFIIYPQNVNGSRDDKATFVYLLTCNYSGCNRHFPPAVDPNMDRSLSGAGGSMVLDMTAMQCYVCSEKKDPRCGLKMVREYAETVVKFCRAASDQRCVMSYSARDGRRSSFKRSCLRVQDQRIADRAFEEPLSGRDPKDKRAMTRMFVCGTPLCNENYPAYNERSKQQIIGPDDIICHTCESLEEDGTVTCLPDVSGPVTPEDAPLEHCPTDVAYECNTVIRINVGVSVDLNEAVSRFIVRVNVTVSVARGCMKKEYADMYRHDYMKQQGPRSQVVAYEDTSKTNSAGFTTVIMELCNTSACNQNFTQPELVESVKNEAEKFAVAKAKVGLPPDAKYDRSDDEKKKPKSAVVMCQLPTVWLLMMAGVIIVCGH